MKNLCKAFMVVAVISVAGSAMAQEVVREADKTVVRQKTVIDFQDVIIDGEIKKPEGSYTIGHANARFGNLVKMRSDFMPELQKSADNL